MRRWLVVLIAMALAAGSIAARSANAASRILVVDIKGPISVATAMEVEWVLDKAAEEHAELVVLRLDTPGGLVDATRTMIQSMLASKVPVAVHVAPSGARAASAGTYIAYAAHVAAMAPGTHLGAATPVQIGGTPPGPAGGKPGETPTAMERKIINDAVAYIRTLAELRGRNGDWAEKAVREAATLTAEEAVRDKVVDLLATDTDSLLAAIDGRTVKVGGVERRLATKGAEVSTVGPDWRMRILSLIADPNIALILVMLGFYGLVFEFWHPGAAAPGILGGISLLLGFAALSVLPVSWVGVALLLLGLGLIVAEMIVPGIGALGVGGLAAFVLGAIFLIDPSADFHLAVAWPVILACAVTTGLFLLFILGFAVKARRRPVAAGAEQIIGSAGRVVVWDGLRGEVRVRGEVWAARAGHSLAPGDTIEVTSRDGLTLEVDAR